MKPQPTSTQFAKPRAFVLPRVILLFLAAFTVGSPGRADVDYIAAIFDNDLFIGNDNGYTNGTFISLFDVGGEGEEFPTSDFWVVPLKWSLPDTAMADAVVVVNGYTVGQALGTPGDITVADPPRDELPYSSLIALTNSFVVVTPVYADLTSTTIGLVGPSALGEEVQTFVHDLIGADEPQGWDTQLGDEIVLQFTRARTWRTWAADSGAFDLLTNAEIAAGTLSSQVSAGAIFRYGRELDRSYATTILTSTRTANPGAVNEGWFVYGSVHGGYTFNQIFADGNTFRDSRSADYTREFISVSAGVAVGWRNLLVSFALTDFNLLEDRNSDVDDFTRYGTISVGWRL